MVGGLTVVGANQAIQALQNTEIKVSLNGQITTELKRLSLLLMMMLFLNLKF